MKIQFPEIFVKLFDKDWRYFVGYGGRAGLKSWSVAQALLIRGNQEPLRILCTREIQNSINDSVHHLLRSQIDALGLGWFYTTTDTEIRGANGTQFIFMGLRTNITKVKSYEDVDICWIEEAANISKYSYDVLIPTIRKQGSQIIITFNPELDTDETYKRFVLSSPPDTVKVFSTYKDNPWFTETLRKEMEDCKVRDPVAYENIWLGRCRSSVEGAIFASEIHQAEKDGRICDVPYDKTIPVNTYWDLGKSAMTAIWFAQYVGMQWRILRHYSNHLKELSHYLKYVQELPYLYDKHYLPHDAEQERLGMEHSIKVQAAKVLRSVVVVPRVSHKINSINAAKEIFPMCYFDREKCETGLTALRRYAYKITPETGKISNEPEEGNFWRDSADAFQCFAMARRAPKPPKDEIDEIVERQNRMRKNQSTGAWWKR
jgi:phage terminase large subunit